MDPLLEYTISLGSTSYPAVYNGFVAAVNAYANEIEAGRQGQDSLAENFSRYILSSTGLTQNLLANNNRITGLPVPVDSSDAATKGFAEGLAFAAALPSGGDVGQIVRLGPSGAGWDETWGPATQLDHTDDGQTLDQRTTYHVDSNGGAFELLLPPITAGGWVLIRDVGNWAGHNEITLIPDGTDDVYGLTQNYVMNRSGENLLLVCDSVKGWVRG